MFSSIEGKKEFNEIMRGQSQMQASQFYVIAIQFHESDSIVESIRHMGFFETEELASRFIYDLCKENNEE